MHLNVGVGNSNADVFSYMALFEAVPFPQRLRYADIQVYQLSNITRRSIRHHWYLQGLVRICIDVSVTPLRIKESRLLLPSFLLILRIRAPAQ